MLRKIIDTVIIAIMITLLLVLVVRSLYTPDYSHKNINEVDAEDLVITEAAPANYGSVTVYSAGTVDFQYYGDIEIVNDGTNGQEIEIIVNAEIKELIE